MIILGIDPGYDRLGLAIIAKEKGAKECVLFSECITTPKTSTFSQRLLAVGNAIEDAISGWHPTHLALEKLFFENNQKTAMAVSEVRGAIIYIASLHDLVLCEYTPAQVKNAVTGSGRADKKQMIAMIPKLIHLPHTPKHDDEYDALGVALTCAASVH